jgi:hypothetical protein
MKKLLALLVLLAAALGSCVVREPRRRCPWGYHFNGSFCQENGRRVCPRGYHYDGYACVQNARQRWVGEAESTPVQ